MSHLPKGYDQGWLWATGSTMEDLSKTENETSGYKPTDLTKVCQCGVYVTYGENAPIEFHQSWCQLSKKKD